MNGESLTGRFKRDLPALAGFGLPFVLVLYLALEAGGYDLTVRGQAGIVVWWVVLLGVVFGLFPVARVTRPGWILLALLGGLALWTGVGALTWSESTERSLIELSRVVTLLGVALLLFLAQGRKGLQRTVSAVGTAIAVVAVIALASRYQPQWFPASGIPGNFPVSRLSHPVEYWNALASLLAVGLAPLLWLAASGRSVAGRAVATAGIPLVLLACYLTASRGGAIAAAAAIVVLLALHPRRLTLVPTALIAGLGAGALLLLIAARPELRDRELGDLATTQGDEMLWLTLAVCLLVALGQIVLVLAERRGSLRYPEPGPAAAKGTGLLVALVAVMLLLVAIASGFAGDRWNEFKEPAATDGTVSRLGNLSSGERYKVWSSAIDAARDQPLTGTGPGTFEFWWAREGTGVQFVRDGHSLYLEALAELGPLGLILVLALVLVPIGYTSKLAVGSGSAGRRGPLAAAAGGMTAFAVTAGIDWAWEMTVIPVAFLALAAAALGPAGESRRGRRTSRFTPVPLDPPQRVAVAAASMVAIVVIAVPLVGDGRVDESQRLFREGDIPGSLEKAEEATDLMPYSARAAVQRALVLDALGRTAEAIEEAERATEAEATNWRNWLVLSELAAKAGDPQLARSAERRRAQLNDHGPSLDED